MRDLVHNLKVVAAAPAATRSASLDGDAVDLKGFDSVMLAVVTGAVTGAGNMTVKVQESDESATGFADVDPDHLQGAGLTNPLVANATTKIGYRGFKRYLRAVLTLNSGTSVTVGAVWLLGGAVDKPVA